MTPSDAQRIERLVADLREGARTGWLANRANTLMEAADLIGRLRVDAERMRAFAERLADGLSHMSWCRTCAEDGEECCDIGGKEAKQAMDEYRAATAPMRAEKEDGCG